MPNRMRQALRDFVAQKSARGTLLVIAAAAGLAMANSPLSSLYFALLDTSVGLHFGALAIAKPLLSWINDGLMAVFFLLVGLEIKREILEGELSDPRQAMLPAVAAICGMAVPALIYATINFGDREALAGWAIPAATDIAFALGVLSLLGNRVPVGLRVFLLAVATFDDLGAIVIIAMFYAGNLAPIWLGCAAAILLGLLVLNRSGVARLAPYVLLGVVLWVAVLNSGIHATIAGVALSAFIPLHTSGRGSRSLLRRLERDLRMPVIVVILPLFAFANSGVLLENLALGAFVAPVAQGIATGLLFGKTIGIFLSVWLMVRFAGARLPAGATWDAMFGVALLCGIGFTMSLLMAHLAFPGAESAYALETRLGILLGSLASALIGYAILRWVLPPQDDRQPSRAAAANPGPRFRGFPHEP